MLSSMLARLFLLILVVVICTDNAKAIREGKGQSSVSQQSRNTLPSFSIPFQLPHFSGSAMISPLGQKKSRVNKSQRVRTTELSPVQGLLNTARDGVLDIGSSVRMIAASKSSEEFLENTLSALARHKVVTVAGLLGVYYFVNRSIPDPMSSAKRMMGKQQSKEMSKWGSNLTRR